MLELQKLANDAGMLILMLHHTLKMDAEDPFDTISGTLGLSGCADTLCVLARNHHGTSRRVKGRDVEDSEKAVRFNTETCRWEILGEAADVRRSDTRRSILSVLSGGDEIGTRGNRQGNRHQRRDDTPKVASDVGGRRDHSGQQGRLPEA